MSSVIYYFSCLFSGISNNSVTYASQIVESGNRMKTCKESWLQNGLYLVNVKNVAVVKQM